MLILLIIIWWLIGSACCAWDLTRKCDLYLRDLWLVFFAGALGPIAILVVYISWSIDRPESNRKRIVIIKRRNK